MESHFIRYRRLWEEEWDWALGFAPPSPAPWYSDQRRRFIQFGCPHDEFHHNWARWRNLNHQDDYLAGSESQRRRGDPDYVRMGFPLPPPPPSPWHLPASTHRRRSSIGRFDGESQQSSGDLDHQDNYNYSANNESQHSQKDPNHQDDYSADNESQHSWRDSNHQDEYSVSDSYNENGKELDNSIFKLQKKRTGVITNGLFQRMVMRFQGRRKLSFLEESRIAVSHGTVTPYPARHASLIQKNAELENRKERLVSSELKHLHFGARKFTYQQLTEATGGFTEEIGSGGFGTVFKGTLQGVGTVAVKVIKKTQQSLDDAKQLVAEVQVIGRLRHANIVPLRGWCYDEGVMLLVYEFVDNGDLHTHLFPKNPSEPLSWEKRIKALQGVASALVFLHEDFGSKERVIHRDIKPMNVMLDSEFNAHLGDFGLARVSKRTAPSHQSEMLAFTPGYVAPEYKLGATVQTDVYSFGIVVLVVATGRKPLDASIPGWPGLVKWVRNFYDEGKIVEAGDTALRNGSELSLRDREEMEVVLKLGLSCCVYEPSQRPTMREAYVALHPWTILSKSLPPQFPSPVEFPSLEKLMFNHSGSGASWPTNSPNLSPVKSGA